jgi:hypothetical protein
MKIYNSCLLLAILLLTATKAFAVCPVCAFVVGAGVGLSRWLGIDDSVTGLWVGGLVVALVGWTINWLNKKNIRFYGRKILVTVFYYASVFIPMHYMKITGGAFNKLWGMDKLLLGTAVGSLAFLFASIWYEHLKLKNADKAYFPLQKVVMPVVTLLALSLIFYCITK